MNRVLILYFVLTALVLSLLFVFLTLVLGETGAATVVLSLSFIYGTMKV